MFISSLSTSVEISAKRPGWLAPAQQITMSGVLFAFHVVAEDIIVWTASGEVRSAERKWKR